jgi:2Fe-2S ferredoxin
MIPITYLEPSGSEVKIDAEDGWTVMQAAMSNGIEGIVAECGGSCVCATCHVYVDPKWVDQIPPPSDDELELLEEVKAERKSNSRLSCQIRIENKLAGLVITVPERQN